MITFPPCKINLGLNIIRKRPDGFHDIETCFYPLPWTDILEIIPHPVFSFTQSGIVIPGKESENLCVKAYTLLRRHHRIPDVSIHLHKTIPAGAGLGGGSSDAAFTIRMLNELFQLGMSNDEMQHAASQLGSDCAFFINPEVKFGREKGNVLDSLQLTLRNKFMVVVKPEIHVSTADAYAGVQPATAAKPLREILERHPLSEWASLLENDFERSIFQKYPAIKTIKEKLYASGAVYASMSGSGSSVFGIFDRPVDIRREFPGMIYWFGELEV